jgi:hypothetical protein
MMTAKGSPKPVETGKRGNVGGISTPGRHGNHAAAMKAGVKNLVMPGPGTKKTPVIANQIRPEPNPVHIDAGNVKRASGTMKMASGSPKDISAGSGHKGIHVGTRPEGPIKHDEAGTIKPKAKV